MSDRRHTGPQGLETEETAVIGAVLDDDPIPVIELLPESDVRRILAIIYSTGMTIGLLLVIVGGLVHAFDPALVGSVFAAYSGVAGSAAYFYFRHRGEGRQ